MYLRPKKNLAGNQRSMVYEMKENDINIDTGIDVIIYKLAETMKNIVEFKQLVSAVRKIELTMGDGIKKMIKAEASIVVNLSQLLDWNK